MKFSDGMEIDTTGELRTIHKSDGWYVVGGGFLTAVDSKEAGEALIKEMTIPKCTPKIVKGDHLGKPIWNLELHWSGVDRAHTSTLCLGYTPAKLKILEAACRAVRDGKLFVFKEILTDVNGNTYVSTESGMGGMGKYLKSDLKKLGYLA